MNQKGKTFVTPVVFLPSGYVTPILHNANACACSSTRQQLQKVTFNFTLKFDSFSFLGGLQQHCFTEKKWCIV